jgi:hypothetical protein
MKTKLLIGAFAIVSQIVAIAQNTSISVKPYGYVSYECIFDSRKSVDSRDGELYLYPVRKALDVEGKDINSRSYLQMLALQARFGFNITGPDIGTAKTSAQMEADFYGTGDSYVNMVRLRQAWFKLAWENSELILGQTSHPTIISDCSPTVLSFGSGVPYHSLNRSVQARFNYKASSSVKLSIAALMGSTHVSVGPRDAQRRSGLPELQAQVQFGSAEKILFGLTGGYKFLSVLDTTSLGFKTTQRIGSYNTQAFFRYTAPIFTVKAQANYGTNLTNLSFIGGYGVKAESQDPVTGEVEFTNITTFTSWLDLESKLPNINFGLFCGYSQNLGCEDNLDLTTSYNRNLFYTKNADISYIFRIAPRVFIKKNNLLYGLEWGINGAAYTTEYNLKRKATKTDDLVYNNRILLLVKYNF